MFAILLVAARPARFVAPSRLSRRRPSAWLARREKVVMATMAGTSSPGRASCGVTPAAAYCAGMAANGSMDTSPLGARDCRSECRVSHVGSTQRDLVGHVLTHEIHGLDQNCAVAHRDCNPIIHLLNSFLSASNYCPRPQQR